MRASPYKTLLSTPSPWYRYQVNSNRHILCSTTGSTPSPWYRYQVNSNRHILCSTTGCKYSVQRVLLTLTSSLESVLLFCTLNVGFLKVFFVVYSIACYPLLRNEWINCKISFADLNGLSKVIACPHLSRIWILQFFTFSAIISVADTSRIYRK